jgi:hypothetical protein
MHVLQFRGVTFFEPVRMKTVGNCWKIPMKTGRGGRIPHTSRGCARIVEKFARIRDKLQRND